MRYRPQDYQFRRRIEAVIEPPPNFAEAVVLWSVALVLTVFPIPIAWLQWLFGEEHVREIFED